jgi:hypothetical protein
MLCSICPRLHEACQKKRDKVRKKNAFWHGKASSAQCFAYHEAAQHSLSPRTTCPVKDENPQQTASRIDGTPFRKRAGFTAANATPEPLATNSKTFLTRGQDELQQRDFRVQRGERVKNRAWVFSAGVSFLSGRLLFR